MNKWSFLLRIHFHPLFWFVAAIAIMTARFYELIILIMIVLIHEIGHAMAASFFSWRIKQILLLPFGGVLEVEEYGNKPIREELIVVLSGPLQHLWLLAGAFILNQFSFFPYDLYQIFVEFNLMILLFNCIPILPLDGGKIVYLLLAKYFPFQKAIKLALIISSFFLFLYIGLILIVSPFHLNGWLIAIFLLISLYKEWKNRPFLFIRYLVDKYTETPRTHLIDKKIKAMTYHSISDVVAQFQRGVYHTVVVHDLQGKSYTIPESVLIQNYFEKNPIHVKLRDLLF